MTSIKLHPKLNAWMTNVTFLTYEVVNEMSLVFFTKCGDLF